MRARPRVSEFVKERKRDREGAAQPMQRMIVFLLNFIIAE